MHSKLRNLKIGCLTLGMIYW